MSSGKVTYEIVEGGLLNNKYLLDGGAAICLQSNCVARKRHAGSLHDNLFKMLGFGDPYKQRRGKTNSKNLAIIEDRPQLGSVSVVQHPTEPERFCSMTFLFAQYNMGNGRKCYFPNDKEYVESCKKHERVHKSSTEMKRLRLYYFNKCLHAIAKSPAMKKYNKIIFPARIGCAAAGGDWEKYHASIRDFSTIIDKEVIIVSQRM
ncbi:hypothetical protein SWSSV_gp069 [White spot syndrome virus]|uniref:Wsv206 n=3 Tax=White spot syndrome virus TaxID=342409 RepID=Q8VB06_WSSVS|nr:wsv206 [Shrimp white spot syndrome virus]YP_009220543.1 hypothetical protein SWSSV_gp069 [White spot syndrome virus]AYW76563.1 hypothetical protein [Procambarus clarkii virus]AAL33210.1 wsv206 [Shrimp white spot syndrome virus]AAL89129.1 WSSV261 [Shrimp white spot syndrome virus]AFX59583.1 wsv206 [White spot syndrome virus]ALN66193.1 hypothetical protein [White spot syndrome virus]